MDISWICPHVCIEIHSFSFCAVSTVFFLLVFVLGAMLKYRNGALTSVVSQLQQF